MGRGKIWTITGCSEGLGAYDEGLVAAGVRFFIRFDGLCCVLGTLACVWERVRKINFFQIIFVFDMILQKKDI